MAALEKYGDFTLAGLVDILEAECRSRDKAVAERAERDDEINKKREIIAQLQLELKIVKDAQQRQAETITRQREEIKTMGLVLRGKDKEIADYQQQLLDALRTPPFGMMPKSAKEWEPYIADILAAASNCENAYRRGLK